MSKEEEINLVEADAVLEDYPVPYSLVDNGNLFFAATEYRKAYRELERKLELAEKCLQYFVDRVEGFHPHGQIRSQRTYTMFKQALAQIGEEIKND